MVKPRTRREKTRRMRTRREKTRRGKTRREKTQRHRTRRRVRTWKSRTGKGIDTRTDSCKVYVPYCSNKKLETSENIDKPCNEFFFKDRKDIYRPCRHGRLGNKSQCRDTADFTKIECPNQSHARETAERQQHADEREKDIRRQETREYERSKLIAAEKKEYAKDEIYLATHPTQKLRSQEPKSLSQYVETPPKIGTSQYVKPESLQEDSDSTAISNIRTGWASDY